MAVFTAIATAIVGAIGVAATATAAGTLLGSAFLFNMAVGVIATGLAVGTAKLLGVYSTPTQGPTSDPGVKVQLPPTTDNKVAKLYGRNFGGGIIIDAEIKKENQTMAYCIVLSEYTEGEVWSINKIYRGDAQLLFGTDTTPGAEFAPWVVVGQIDPNATSSTNIKGKLRCRVYAGGSTAAHQVFPTVTPANAYADGSDGFCQFKNWTAANTMEGLVFAIFEIDYDAENNLYGLDAITFDSENSVSNPADVLLDYMRNTRYGCKLANSQIDLNSFSSWQTYCAEPVDYLSNSNVVEQHERYRIDGVLSTFNSCKQNINKICQNSGALFTYDGKVGQFGVVPLRAVSAEAQANAFVFSPDNIVSAITATSTDLFNLFNAVEVEYPSVIQKDQTDIYFAEISETLRNPNEPDNVLTARFDMVNDRTRVASLANIDLNQSRLSTVVNFTADHSALVVDVGDVAKLTDPLYGFNQKLFRVMRIQEQEAGDGVLTVGITLLEYDDDVYADLLTQEDFPPAPNGISNYFALYADVEPDLGDILLYPNADASSVEVYTASSGAFTGNISVNSLPGNIVLTAGAAVSQPLVAVGVKLPTGANASYSAASVTLIPYDETATVLPGRATYDFAPPEAMGRFSSDTEYAYLAMPLTGAGITFLESPNVNSVAFAVSFYDSATNSRSTTSTSALVDVRAENYIPKEDLAIYAAGFQAVESFPNKLDLSNVAVYVPLTTVETYDLTGTSYGAYPFYGTGQTLGGLATPYDAAFAADLQVTYIEEGTLNTLSYSYDTGLAVVNTETSEVFSLTKDIIIDPAVVGLPAGWTPYQLSAQFVGWTTQDANSVGDRGFTGLYYEIGKITKAER